MPNPVIPIRPPYKPELLHVVQLAIEHILAHGGDVFEYGSGYSTIWLAEMARTISVEHDQGWYDEVIDVLNREQIDARVQLIPADDLAYAIDDHGLFDLILVDCLEHQRNAAVRAALAHVRPGGWMILDDSHWPSLAQARKILSRWPKTIVSGLHKRHTGVWQDHQTSLYRRPVNA